MNKAKTGGSKDLDKRFGSKPKRVEMMGPASKVADRTKGKVLARKKQGEEKRFYK